MAKVLLTGASGFIGSHIAELLSREGIPLKCLVRPTSNVAFLQQLQVELVSGDLTDFQSLLIALQDVDFVIHTAGKSSDWGKRTDFYIQNVLGTMNILKACRACKITNVISTGSISSYGEENSHQLKTEESPYKSHYPYFLGKLFPSAMNYYRDTKALQTQKACGFATDNDLNLTVLEPAWVYGEREFNTGFFAYLKAVHDGMHYAPGSKGNNFQVIYARDLAQAYLLAYRKKLKGVNRIIIGNHTPVKLNSIHTLFCEAANLKNPKLLPKALVYPLGFGMELCATLLCNRKPPLLSRSRVNMMYDSICFSAAKAKQLLGFEVNTPLQEGITQTVNWYQQNGYL